MELRELAHAITIDILAVRETVILVLVAFTLVLRFLVVVFLIITSLVKEWRVGIVQDVLRVRSYFPKGVDKSFSSSIDFRISVVQGLVVLRPLRVGAASLRAQVDVLSVLVLHGPLHPLLIRVDAESSVRVLQDAFAHELIFVVLRHTLHIRRRLNRVLDLPLALTFLFFLPKLDSQLPPLSKEARHIFHSMVRVEESSHCVEQILVPVKVLFLFNELQFEASAHRLILQGVVVLNVVNQLLEQVVAVVDLKQGCILLVAVDALHLLVVVPSASGLLPDHIRTSLVVILRVEQITNWGLHFLLEFKHLNDVGLLSIVGASRLPDVFAFLISEEVVLGLVGVCILIPLFLVPARDAILIDA